jgi:hypothetical protein
MLFANRAAQTIGQIKLPTSALKGNLVGRYRFFGRCHFLNLNRELIVFSVPVGLTGPDRKYGMASFQIKPEKTEIANISNGNCELMLPFPCNLRMAGENTA